MATEGGPPSRQRETGQLAAIGFKLASVVAFVAMGTVIRLTEGIPIGQILFFRSFFGILPIALYLAWRGQLRTSVRTARPRAHIVRGLVGMAGMALSFMALVRLPLPESIALGYATPLLAVVLGALVLRERVQAYRWVAVTVGLAGVLIISWPNLTVLRSGDLAGDDRFVGVVAALLGAATSAWVVLLIRQMGRTEASSTIVLWFSISCTGFSLASIAFGWVWPTATEAGLLALGGLLGGIGQIAMTEGYRQGDISVVAPFEYTSILLGGAIGYAVFGHVPTVHMLIGGAIVVATGMFMIWMQRR